MSEPTSPLKRRRQAMARRAIADPEGWAKDLHWRLTLTTEHQIAAVHQCDVCKAWHVDTGGAFAGGCRC